MNNIFSSKEKKNTLNKIFDEDSNSKKNFIFLISFSSGKKVEMNIMILTKPLFTKETIYLVFDNVLLKSFPQIKEVRSLYDSKKLERLFMIKNFNVPYYLNKNMKKVYKWVLDDNIEINTISYTISYEFIEKNKPIFSVGSIIPKIVDYIPGYNLEKKERIFCFHYLPRKKNDIKFKANNFELKQSPFIISSFLLNKKSFEIYIDDK